MLVGGAGVGKTTIYQMLKESMIRMIENNGNVGEKYYDT